MNDIRNLLLQVIEAALFEKKAPFVSNNQICALIKESKAQAVFPLTFYVLDSQLQDKLTPEHYFNLNEEFLRYAIAGTQNFAEHSELHELLSSKKIPYVILKGYASAMYYPEPTLRSMGDVDFLVAPENLTKTGMALESIGFEIDHGTEDDGIHVAYTRSSMSIWEMHRSVNGVPSGEIGKRIQAELDRTIDTAVETSCDGVLCRVPDRFHHGLIVLLHTASHLTSEGVGLRHLCDWIVFASALSDADFRKIFERKLESFGLWRFAQVLTLLGIRYLGAPKRVWALEAVEGRKVDDDTLEGLLNDILSGGNFGTKDMNRYREIKYISNRGERTVNSGSVMKQGFNTLNKKVCSNYKMIDKYRVLLPFGYIVEGGKYLGLILSGKRKTSGTKQMLNEAIKRKKVYSRLRLFEK